MPLPKLWSPGWTAPAPPSPPGYATDPKDSELSPSKQLCDCHNL